MYVPVREHKSLIGSGGISGIRKAENKFGYPAGTKKIKFKKWREINPT